MSIARLPVEVFREIFVIVTRDAHPSQDGFTAGNNHFDCIALVDLSRVCRFWRELSLEFTALWATPNIYLSNPSNDTIYNAAHFLDLCLKRSERLHLTCMIRISRLKSFSPQTIFCLVDVVVAHRSRWESVVIDVDIASPSGDDDDAEGLQAYRDFAIELGERRIHLFDIPIDSLKILCLSQASQFTPYDSWIGVHGGPGTPVIPSLEHLHLFDLQNSTFTILQWLRLAPNLVSLTLTTIENLVWSDVREYYAEYHFTMLKLRSIRVPLIILHLLVCPSVQSMEIDQLGSNSNDVGHFTAFTRRNAIALQSLKVHNIPSRRYWILIGYLRPTITSFSLNAEGKNVSLFTMRLTELGDDNARLRWLPVLEHLELVEWRAETWSPFGDLLDRRWRAPNRTLKSWRMVRCSPSPPSYFKFGEDPANVPEEWRSIQQYVNEGLLFEVTS